jgi:hypothetical protein
MSTGKFTVGAEDWVLAESGGAEQFLAYLGELPSEEQRSLLASHGIREALIDCGQEQALRQIERGWSEAPRNMASRIGHATPLLAL